MGATVPTATSKAASTALIAIPDPTVPFHALKRYRFDLQGAMPRSCKAVLRLRGDRLRVLLRIPTPYDCS